MGIAAARTRPTGLAKGPWIAIAITFVLTGGIAGVAEAQTQCDANTPRIELRIFQYSGVKTDEQESKFAKFHQILFENLLQLGSESKISGLKIRPSPRAKLPNAPQNLDEMRAGWDDVWCSTLFLLSGSVDQDGGTYEVDSLVYWGQLKPEGMQEFIKARMAITAQGQLTANDTHSLITMFALAMDAKRRHAQSSIVQKLLQLARNKALDIANHGELVGALAQIKDYIDAQIMSSDDAQK